MVQQYETIARLFRDPVVAPVVVLDASDDVRGTVLDRPRRVRCRRLVPSQWQRKRPRPRPSQVVPILWVTHEPHPSLRMTVLVAAHDGEQWLYDPSDVCASERLPIPEFEGGPRGARVLPSTRAIAALLYENGVPETYRHVGTGVVTDHSLSLALLFVLLLPRVGLRRPHLAAQVIEKLLSHTRVRRFYPALLPDLATLLRRLQGWQYELPLVSRTPFDAGVFGEYVGLRVDPHRAVGRWCGVCEADDEVCNKTVHEASGLLFCETHAQRLLRDDVLRHYSLPLASARRGVVDELPTGQPNTTDHDRQPVARRTGQGGRRSRSDAPLAFQSNSKR